MLKTEDQRFLRDLLAKSFKETDEVKLYNIDSATNYILLDTSDVYERLSDAPFYDLLIYSCIELALYREGYHKTAKQFCEFWNEEHHRQTRLFKEEKN